MLSQVLPDDSVETLEYDFAVLPDDEDFASLELSGFAHQALDDLVARAHDGGDEGAVALDALGLLYRLSGVGS